MSLHRNQGLFPLPQVRLMMLLTGLCLIGLAAGFVVETTSGPRNISLSLYIIAYLSGGLFPLRDAYEGARKRTVDVNVLMLGAAIGAAIIDFWHEGATLKFLSHSVAP